MEQRNKVLETIAKGLNVGGSALVTGYDVGSVLFQKGFESLKSAAVQVPVVVKSGIEAIKPKEKRVLEREIRNYQNKIEGLYYKIGEVSVKHKNIVRAQNSEEVKNLISLVTEHEMEIEKIRERITEIEKVEKEELLKVMPKPPQFNEEMKASILSLIDNAEKDGSFESDTEKNNFIKTARRLISDEPVVRVLAAMELGRIRNRAATSILTEAEKLNDPDFTAEIMYSLTAINDPSALPLFREKIADRDIRIRLYSLLALYEFDFTGSIPLIIDALKDSHSHIRIAAATLLGWKGAKEKEIPPALINALEDSEVRVRMAAFDALKLVTDKDIEFDVYASGEAISEGVKALKESVETKPKAAPRRKPKAMHRKL
ncbi:MAG: HEAT repeat domain-containing protein [Nitrospinae bacterium]|nr:HEAT repeat domain-containing protein [Nitrospinota bacterium]